MFGLNVLQNRWLVMALVGGPALVASVVLVYLAFWRQRTEARAELEPSEDPGAPRGLTWLSAFMPWFLIIEIVGLGVYTIVYIIHVALHPPSVW